MNYGKTVSLLVLVFLASQQVYVSIALSLVNVSNVRQVPDDYVLAIDWKPDGTVLAVVRRNGGLYLYDNDLEEIEHLNVPGYGPVKWSPDGTMLAFGTRHDRLVIEIRDSSNLDLIKVIIPRPKEIIKISWNPDDTQLAVVGGEIGEVFDITSGELVNTLDLKAEPRTRTFVYVEWNPNGETIATDGLNNTTAIWDADTGQLLTTYTPSGVIAWNSDGTLLAVATANQAYILDGTTGEITTTIALDTLSITQLIWKGDTLLSLHPRGSGTTTIIIMDATRGEVINAIDIDENILAIAMNSSGTLFAYGGADRTKDYLAVAPVPVGKH